MVHLVREKIAQFETSLKPFGLIRGLPFFMRAWGYEDFSENLKIFRTPRNFSKIFRTPPPPTENFFDQTLILVLLLGFQSFPKDQKNPPNRE